jgi:Insertion element 4 transposase N-terminal
MPCPADPAEQVIWLVLGMALYRDRQIAELVDKLDLALPDGRDLTVARSAVRQARARLGAEPMRWLFERCSRK